MNHHGNTLSAGEGGLARAAAMSAVLGGLAMGLAPLFPFIHVANFSTTGVESIGGASSLGKTAIALFVAGLATFVAGIVWLQSDRALGSLTRVLGLAALGILLVNQYQLGSMSSTLSESTSGDSGLGTFLASALDLRIRIGAGIWVAYVGAILTIVSGLLGFRRSHPGPVVLGGESAPTSVAHGSAGANRPSLTRHATKEHVHR
ncbi:MAG: hypothetical protein RL885_05055 [Planctomycetota bacterium]